MGGFIAQLRLGQHAGQDRTHDGISPGHAGTDIGDSGRVRGSGLGKRNHLFGPCSTDCKLRPMFPYTAERLYWDSERQSTLCIGCFRST